MYFNYYTNRLEISILNSDSAQMVLEFLKQNRQEFEQYEAAKPPAYYTLEYQAANLHNEFSACLAKRYVRFYVFTRENPNKIIGTVSFSNFRDMPYSDAIIGYKFDSKYRGLGYATEAIDQCLSIAFEAFKLHRIEALIMPDNISSINLVKRLGFDYEGTAMSIIKIDGKWQAHERYSLINPID